MTPAPPPSFYRYIIINGAGFCLTAKPLAFCFSLVHIGFMRGRPSIYTPELGDQIAALFSCNMSFREIAAIEGMPSDQSFYEWMDRNEDFSGKIARARIAAAEAARADIIEVTREVRNGQIDANPGSVVIKSLQWQASKANPKVYGDRQILAGDAENPLQMLAVRLDQAIAKSEALEARDRMIDVTPVQGIDDLI